MISKRTVAFILFYIAIIILMLFTFFYVQKYYRYEVKHKISERVIFNRLPLQISTIPNQLSNF